jgi:hypothetical protein
LHEKGTVSGTISGSRKVYNDKHSFSFTVSRKVYDQYQYDDGSLWLVQKGRGLLCS